VSVAAAVLAAGRGERFTGSTPKPLALLSGRPLVEWALAAACGSGLDPVLLVVDDADSAIASRAPEPVEVVVVPEAERGIAHSLQAVLRALDDRTEIDAVCIGLADQPLVGAASYQRLAAAHDRGAHLAVATYKGARGNPVLIARALWPRARALRGDIGARALMGTASVVEVDCTDTGSPRDVDTLDDLHAVEQQLGPA
jgi:CTP:molybdopterin cytidylyltransferase MocA